MKAKEKTLYRYLCEYAAADESKRFLFDAYKQLTVKQVLCAVNSLAAQMAKTGVRAGELVALEASRRVDTALLLYALLAIGAVTVLTDPRTAAEKFLEDSATGIFPQWILSAKGEGCLLQGKGKESFLFFERDGADDFIEATDPYAPAYILFTSGSTGGSKAVVLSQFGVLNNAEDTLARGWYLSEDINMALLPIFHVFGLSLVLTAAVARHSVFFPKNTDIPSVVRAIETYGITRMNGVPSLYLALAGSSAWQNREHNTLRTGLIGGGPCTGEQFIQIEQRLGMTLIPVYGMSECIGISCGDYQDDVKKRSASVGRPYSMNTVFVIGNDGEKLALGQEGEICVDSPFRMLGYYGEKADRSVLRTGDIGYFDEEGFLYISGRKKDIIIRNGNNISTADIERALLALGCVREAAVVGIPDENCGEVPCAMIVLQENVFADEKDIRNGLAGKLKKNEMPHHICFAQEIPLTSTGKPDKCKIREVFATWQKV